MNAGSYLITMHELQPFDAPYFEKVSKEYRTVSWSWAPFFTYVRTSRPFLPSPGGVPTSVCITACIPIIPGLAPVSVLHVAEDKVAAAMKVTTFPTKHDHKGRSSGRPLSSLVDNFETKFKVKVVLTTVGDQGDLQEKSSGDVHLNEPT